MWTIAAPKEATHHTYLMHQMLTLAALHIAHEQAQQRATYHALAIHHQDLAIKAIRPKLGHITAENASYLFATSALLSMAVFGERALAAHTSTAKPALEDLLDCFGLIQGMCDLRVKAYPYVLSGPFAPILIPGTTVIPPQPVYDVLLDRIPDAVAFIGAQTDAPEEMQRECLIQLFAFKDILLHDRYPMQDNRELRSLFFWPMNLPPGFPAWVRERRGPALVLLALYAVLLRAAETVGEPEPTFWYFAGWAARVMGAVAEAVDDVWRPGIEWQWDFVFGPQAQAQVQVQAQVQQQHAALGEDAHMQL